MSGKRRPQTEASLSENNEKEASLSETNEKEASLSENPKNEVSLSKNPQKEASTSNTTFTAHVEPIKSNVGRITAESVAKSFRLVVLVGNANYGIANTSW